LSEIHHLVESTHLHQNALQKLAPKAEGSGAAEILATLLGQGRPKSERVMDDLERSREALLSPNRALK
jgi:hypothetical protein